MGKHGPGDDTRGIGDIPTEVTLERVLSALEGLGFDALEGTDRVVVPAHFHTATVWVNHEKPLMLVVDSQQRVPVDFEHGAPLARFINEWNHDHVGPSASYRLADAGDFDVRLRSGIRTKHGLTDEQLLLELADCLEHMASFSLQLRERFLPIGFDHPLPPTLLRAQDTEVLLGRHPRERHLPRGGSQAIGDAPDPFSRAPREPDHPDSVVGLLPTQRVGMDEVEDTFDTLDFAYALTPEEVLATGINGVPFAVCIDAESYVRVTSMWDTGRTQPADFLPLWLICNGVNEMSSGLRAYLHELDGSLHVHVETTCMVGAGLSPGQLHNYMLTSLVAVLGAVDAISTQIQGTSAVRWPTSGG